MWEQSLEMECLVLWKRNETEIIPANSKQIILKYKERGIKRWQEKN